MTLVGFPDFQEQAQWQSPVAVEKVVNVTTGTTYSFPDTGPVYFNVSNWNATQLRLTSNVVVDVECVWWDAIPAGAYLARSDFSLPANGDGVVSLPNAGPYLQVNVTNNSGSTSNLVAVIAFTNRRQQPFIVPFSTPLIVADSVSVGGGATVRVSSQQLFSGVASVWTFTSAAIWHIDLKYKNSAGTEFYLAQFNNVETSGGAERRSMVVLPPRPCFVDLANGDAGAQNFWATVSGDVYR